MVEKEVEECPICYEEIGAKNFCVTACGHKFCMGCIPKHLANSNACPMCRANIVDVGTDSIVVEVTGSEDKIAALQDLLNPYTVIQMMRTGRVAMTRGNNKEV